MTIRISELKIIKVTNEKGLEAIVSFVLNDCLFLSSIAIYKRFNEPNKYRLVYPTKNKQGVNYAIIKPINKDFAKSIEEKVISLYLQQND